MNIVRPSSSRMINGVEGDGDEGIVPDEEEYGSRSVKRLQDEVAVTVRS